MLVLSRKNGEQVIIGGGIVLTVTEVSNARVRIGVEAPKNVSILRDELAEATEVRAFRRQWMMERQEKKPVAMPKEDAGCARSEVSAVRPGPAPQGHTRSRPRMLRRIPR
jgi:carbon storage regulator CsrA